MAHKWVVSVIDAGRSVEIAVVRDDNVHGKQSLGWDGPQKYIITLSLPVPPWLRDATIASAQKLADELTATNCKFYPGVFG